MKKRFACLALALVLAFALLPATAVAAGRGTERIVTSYDPDNYLELAISGDTLTVSGKLRIEGLEIVSIRCSNASEDAEAKVGSEEYFSLRIDLDIPETASVRVFYATHDDIKGNKMTLHGYL